MEDQLFSKKATDRLSSPEQLNDYLRVTPPAVWITLAAVVLLLAGGFFWACFTSVNSFAYGTAQVQNSDMSVNFEKSGFAENVREGQEVIAGSTSSVITSVGRNADGTVFAKAQTSLPDGSYPAKVIYRRTQIIEMLFN